MMFSLSMLYVVLSDYVLMPAVTDSFTLLGFGSMRDSSSFRFSLKYDVNVLLSIHVFSKYLNI